ncbi:MAG: CBS domain-containing protein [Pirellulaceae bacterium]
MHDAFRASRVGDVMVRDFVTLQESDSLELAMQEMAAGNQKDFPVADHDDSIGILLHRDPSEGSG